MRRITRYVLHDLCKVLALCLLGMTAGMVLAFVGQEAVRYGLGASTVVRLAPYMAPNALRFATPSAILLAACCVFGRISAANEATALKSLGVSPMALLAPALALAFVLSLATVWINDVAVTWGRRGVHRVVLGSVEKIAYGMLQTQRAYTSGKLSINVRGVEGRKLIRPTIVIRSDDGEPPLTLTAETAELRRNPRDETLTLLLTNGLAEHPSFRFEFHDTLEREIPLTDASKKGDLSNRPSDYPMARIPKEIERQQERIRQLRQSLAAEAAFGMMTGDFGALAGEASSAARQELKGAQERLHRLQTERWRRWANGFSCFFFVLVGAPLAIRLRNADLWTTFGVCFIPILLLYFPLLMLGVERAKVGAWPPYSVWLGNLLLLAVGLFLLRRVVVR